MRWKSSFKVHALKAALNKATALQTVRWDTREEKAEVHETGSVVVQQIIEMTDLPLPIVLAGSSGRSRAPSHSEPLRGASLPFGSNINMMEGEEDEGGAAIAISGMSSYSLEEGCQRIALEELEVLQSHDDSATQTSFSEKRTSDLTVDTGSLKASPDGAVVNATSPVRSFSSSFSSSSSTLFSQISLASSRRNSTQFIPDSQHKHPPMSRSNSLFASAASFVKHPMDFSLIYDFTKRRMPSILTEREFDTSGYNKVFASLWLNDAEVVMGTKCNRLLVLNTITGRTIEIPSIVGHVVPDALLRKVSGLAPAHQRASGSQRSLESGAGNGAHGSFDAWTWLPTLTRHLPFQVGVNPDHGLATFPSSPRMTILDQTHVPHPYIQQQQQQQQHPQPPQQQQTAPVNRLLQSPSHCYGIHSVSINPSRTLLAVGSGKPTEFIQIYKLPTFEPYAVLAGHKDMIFSINFVTDTLLVSGSRDMSVSLWDIENSQYQKELVTTVNGEDVPIIGPCHTKQEFRGKIRDLKYNRRTNQAVALSTDGFVKLFDLSHETAWTSKRTDAASSRLSVATSIPLIHTNETVCMALDEQHNLFAVGSQAHISIVDPRCSSTFSYTHPTTATANSNSRRGGGVVHVIDSMDNGWGVRSLCLSNGMMTVGGGLGRVSFYDLKAQKYLSCDETAVSHSATAMVEEQEQQQQAQNSGDEFSFLESGSGWLKHDSIYRNYFHGNSIRNAVYTLSYDPSGVRLFAAGGPLQLNLYGSYAGIWM
jgi:WD repeat-containing protein 40A